MELVGKIMDNFRSKGFTLIELLVVVVITTILLSVGIPAFKDFYKSKTLAKAAEALYSDLQNANSEAVRTQSSVYVNVNTTGTWCYGIKSGSDCNCLLANSCQLTTNNTAVSQSLYPGVSLTSSMGNSSLQFEGVRGTSNKTVTFTLSNSGKI